jgi:hypothetical protein
MTPDVILSAMMYRLIERYAHTLPPAERPMFRHAVLDRLRGQPSVPAVEAAISATLGARPLFMLAADSTATKGAIEP